MTSPRAAQRSLGPLMPVVGHLRASAGQFSLAAANFAVNLSLLHALATAEFGVAAFVLVTVQLALGLCNALVSTPYSVGARDPADFLLHKSALLLAVLVGLLVAGLCVVLGAGLSSLLWGSFASLSVLRWFLRNVHLANDRVRAANTSDLVYSSALVGGTVYLAVAGAVLETAAVVMLAAVALGLIAAGAEPLRDLFVHSWRTSLRSYKAIWTQQSGWALVGVLSSEGTSNAHAWLVTFLAGPAHYAPLAAVGLLMRPVTVMESLLTQLERPVMADSGRRGDQSRFIKARRQFQTTMLVVVCLTLAASVAVLAVAPEILDMGAAQGEAYVLLALFGCIAFAAVWRAPVSAAFQATQRFGELAVVGLRAALTALVAATALFLVWGPAASLAGILLGQAVLTISLLRRFSRTVVA